MYYFSHFSSLIYLVIRESHAFYSTFTLLYCLVPTNKSPFFYYASLKASVCSGQIHNATLAVTGGGGGGSKT